MLKNSPWGEVQQEAEIMAAMLKGKVLRVDTAGHGGFMLDKEAMECLHPALKLCSVYGGKFAGFTCFEEDCEAVAVLFELQEIGVSLPALGYRPLTKADVVSYLGHGDTYKEYLRLRGLIDNVFSLTK